MPERQAVALRARRPRAPRHRGRNSGAVAGEFRGQIFIRPEGGAGDLERPLSHALCRRSSARALRRGATLATRRWPTIGGWPARLRTASAARPAPPRSVGGLSRPPCRIGEGEVGCSVGGDRIFHRSPAAIDLVGEAARVGAGGIKANDLRSPQRRQRLAQSLSPRLRIDLPIALGHLPIEAAIEIGILLRGVVVVVALSILVATQTVEILDGRSVGLGEAVDCVAVEGIGDRFSRPHLLLQMDWWQVVVIVIGAAAVATIFVKLASEQCILPPVVERIENRDAIDGQRNRPTQKPVFGGGRIGRRNWIQRNLPSVIPHILLRQRHLLLPGADADHQRVVWNAVGLHVQPAGIAATGDCLELLKRRESVSNIDRYPRLWLGCSHEPKGMFGCGSHDCSLIRQARCRLFCHRRLFPGRPVAVPGVGLSLGSQNNRRNDPAQDQQSARTGRLPSSRPPLRNLHEPASQASGSMMERCSPKKVVPA